MNDLYKPTDDVQWRDFLAKHSIEFLGGNSKNYIVTNTDASDPNNYGRVKLLKIDNRLGMPRHIEQHLRTRLSNVFTPVDAYRQVRGEVSSGIYESRTIMVTDFCASRSIKEHGEMVRATGNNETYENAANLLGKMAQILLDIQSADCCFPDAKLTNWLVDSCGSLRIADTKSFVFTANGIFSKRVPGNEDVEILLQRDLDQEKSDQTVLLLTGKNYMP